jgi:DnaJ-class molecular chaperone
MVKDKTLYDRLNVPVDATEVQIKKSYVNLSRQCHPDKHTEETKEEASNKFKSITEAKDILLDAEKRRLYDQIGMDILKQGNNQMHQNANPFGPGFPFGGGNPFGPGFPFGGGNPFGHGFPFGNQQQQQPTRNVEPIQLSIKLKLDQLYKKETIHLKYSFYKDCQPCQGEGGSVSTCQNCHGKGKRVIIQQMGNMISQHITDCDMCQGKGKIIEDTCNNCKSTGIINHEKTINLTLSPEMTTGDKIKVDKEGNHFKNVSSDLIVTLDIESHPIFKRNGKNLIMKVDLSLYEALFGFTKTLNYIDDSLFTIESSSKTDYHDVKFIMEKSLCIVFTVTIPDIKSVNEIVKPDTNENIKTFLHLINVSNPNEVILAFLNSK